MRISPALRVYTRRVPAFRPLLTPCSPHHQLRQFRLHSSSNGPAPTPTSGPSVTGPGGAKPKLDKTTKYFLLGGILFILMGTLPVMKNNKRYQKALNPDKFLSYTIDSKERVSSDAFLMTLRPEEHDPTVPIPYLSDPVNPANPASSTGAWKYPLWSVEVKQPEIQIVREYTPLPPASAAEAKAGILHFLVRVLPDGEVSRFLDRKLPAEQVELRGPYPTLLFLTPPDRSDDEIVFIAGGSSVAPALQAAHALLETNPTPGKVRILWAVHSRADLDCSVSRDTNRPASSGWFGRSTASVPGLIDLAHGVVQPSPIAQRLQALKAAHGNRFDVRVAVTGEDAVIGEAEIKAALGISANARAGATPAQARAGPYLPVASGPYSEHQPKVVARPGGSGAYKLVLVSGPDGFVDRYAGIIKEDNAPAFRRIRQGGMANEIIDRYSNELDGEWQVVNLD
ncbi:NADH-cytochrome b5 reductase 2 [Ceratocystis fimbriata CBS 114723]|uniref:NADH-cytochrome b5 reductase 2 n=1 Tax=Ceratocystis fimbriata CBS 114723 TaxID=1035309 RepID=A0A2C5X249_9PEZI|nr:NADH-cytochrome b5 reductase 2 [Ceratocystis fimbriata CBS 114723]